MESTQVIGVVPVEAASQVRRRLALSPILGVPAVIWAAHNLRRVLPPAAVVIVSDDPEVADLARSQCVEPLPESADLDPQRLFVHDPAQPFCSAETIRLALSRGAREVSVVQTSVIERLRLEQESDLELLTAVAAGLAPDHPCMQGVRRLRLGLAHAARPFRAVITDVDGVLTDARTTFDDEGVESRAFHMHDGMGTTLLRKADYRIGWLSATRSGGGAAKHRAAVLSVDAVDIGPGDKAPRFTAMCEKLAVAPEETIYIGDDLNDLPAMELAGFSACPADARPEVRARVDLVLATRGGAGVFRELADMLLDTIDLQAPPAGEGQS